MRFVLISLFSVAVRFRLAVGVVFRLLGPIKPARLNIVVICTHWWGLLGWCGSVLTYAFGDLFDGLIWIFIEHSFLDFLDGVSDRRVQISVRLPVLDFSISVLATVSLLYGLANPCLDRFEGHIRPLMIDQRHNGRGDGVVKSIASGMITYLRKIAFCTLGSSATIAPRIGWCRQLIWNNKIYRIVFSE